MKQATLAATFTAFLLCICGVSAKRTWSGESNPEVGGKPLSRVLKELESRNRGRQLRAARLLSKAAVELRPQIVPKLIPYLSAERENTRLPAIQTLGAYGPSARAAVPHLLPLLKGTQFERNRSAAAKALGQILKDARPGAEVEKVAAALAAAFKDKYEDVRREAVFAVGMIGPAAKSAIPAVGRLLSDHLQTVRNAAAWTCGRMGKLAAVHLDRLISLMQNESFPQSDPFFAGAVPEALGLIGAVHANVVPNLADKLEAITSGSAFNPQHDRVAGRIFYLKGVKALERMGPDAKAAVPYFRRILRQRPYRDWERTTAIVRALQAIGPAAAAAAPELKALAEANKPRRRVSLANLKKLKTAAAAALAAVSGNAAGASSGKPKATRQAAQPVP